jgi:hypothetical protein
MRRVNQWIDRSDGIKALLIGGNDENIWVSFS